MLGVHLFFVLIQTICPYKEDVYLHVKQVTYVKQLEGRVQQLEHTENGKVQCGNSDNWPGDNKDVRVNFNTSYSQPPIIHLGVTTFDFDTKHNDRHQASLLSVDKTGFTVRCHTWSDTHIYMMEVSWLSVAN